VAAAVAQISCDALFVASSRPIRDVEAFAISEEDLGNQSEARRPQVFANRGLAGIDGNISTAMGIATRFEKTIALIGDLAFLHDISALANTRTENLTFIVVDNDGGGIFSTLPQRGVPHFEEVFGTPHGKSIKKLATAFGIKAVEVTNVAELLDAAKEKGLKVIVAKMPSRDENADNLKSIFDRFETLTQI
jgi:2-succinyl-5-enolpyruvyl-6-hydroxy-3-cyclohexene-1-carboxylate synthase